MIEKDKTSILLILILSIFVLSSCQNDNNETVNEPENQLIYVNNDGKDDFEISYNYAIINSPTSTEGIICTFKILEDNEILSKEGQPFLFLRNTNEISEAVADPLAWNSKNAHLTSFENHFDQWPDKWEIAANEINNTYFIGVKLNSMNSADIGWIEIEIDERSGIIKILEVEIL